MRILITGARGMLGTDACRYFAEQGHDVIAADLDNGNSSTAVVPVDITDGAAVGNLFHNLKPEIVIHCAAYTNVDGCERDPATAYKVNAEGTGAVAAGAEAVGTSLVAISTDFVFDGRKGSPYVRVGEPNPISQYGRSKHAGERVALELCSRAYVVRTSWLYGVHGNNFPYAIIKRAKEKGEVSVVADQIGTPTYTQDLVRAIDAIIAEPKYGIYHASNDGSTTWFDFARAVLDRVGMSSIPVHPLTSTEYAERFNSPTERPANSVMENRAMATRGLTPMRPWQEALDAFVEEAKAAGKI